MAEIYHKLKLPFLYRIAIWYLASKTARPYDIYKETFCDKRQNGKYYMTKYGLYYGTPYSPLFRKSELTITNEFLQEWN